MFLQIEGTTFKPDLWHFKCVLPTFPVWLFSDWWLIHWWSSIHFITSAWPAINTIITFRIYDLAHQGSKEKNSCLLLYVHSQNKDRVGISKVGFMARGRWVCRWVELPRTDHISQWKYIPCGLWALSWRHTFRTSLPEWFGRTPASQWYANKGALEMCSYYYGLVLFLKLTSRVLL